MSRQPRPGTSQPAAQLALWAAPSTDHSAPAPPVRENRPQPRRIRKATDQPPVPAGAIVVAGAPVESDCPERSQTLDALTKCLAVGAIQAARRAS